MTGLGTALTVVWPKKKEGRLVVVGSAVAKVEPKFQQH